MIKYLFKRILLMLLVLFLITMICFILIRMLPQELPQDRNMQDAIKARWEALGYDKPLLVQFGIYLKNIFLHFDFGTSWYVSPNTDALEVIGDRLWATVLVNLWAMLLSVPIGLLLGVVAALRKNKWQDHLIGVIVILFVSVPSYVYAFLVQYLLCFRLNWFPLTLRSWADCDWDGFSRLIAGFLPPDRQELAKWFSGDMLWSMIPAILSLSFGTVAGLCRYTRAELSDTLSSDYMLLARTKGLTRSQAVLRHGMKNAMVPILPMILSGFVGILGGSLVIEKIFSIPGVGQLYIQSILLRDYDLFMLDTVFYTAVGLLSGIVIDISYGFIDPRIRMGEK